MSDLARSVRQGDVRAAARACRLVDDRLPGHRELLGALWPHTGTAYVVGITGNPGAGKSTLTDRLISELRGEHERVAVVAVDPTSPFTGGAILGDRIRMQRHFDDPGVFIRSLATRGALGGLSRSAMDVVRVLDAWGAGVVLVETVGVGQDELEVTRSADSSVVVMAPGLGDDVQAIKAGLLECADVFVVNKADREGADQTVRDLELMLALGARMISSGGHSRRHSAGTLDLAQEEVEHAAGAWTPPIVKCVATTGEGVASLVAGLAAHREWLRTTEAGSARRSERRREALKLFLRDALAEVAVDLLADAISTYADRVGRGEIDPYAACDELVARFQGELVGATS